MENLLSLADWRRQVAEIYADVRRAPIAGRYVAWQEWRAARDDLLKNHPQSPLDKDQRSRFRGLPYFAYDSEWRIVGSFEPASSVVSVDLDLGADGPAIMTRIGQINFRVKQLSASLSVFWFGGYGGGLFIPFRDTTNDKSSYGGGRYLFDTIKGADLGTNGSEINLDFNYSYNPSCAYHPRWVCPLPPLENSIPFPVRAGESFQSL